MMLKFFAISSVILIVRCFAGGPGYQPPILDKCDFWQHLYQENGKYLKSVCIIYDPKGLNETKEYCKSLNMEIIDVESWDDYAALYQIEHEYIAPYSAEFWVKPPNNTNCYMANLVSFWYM